MWDNPYMQRASYVSIWVWILSEAQFEHGKSVVFKGKRIKLNPGQLTAGAYQISKATGVPRGTVERVVKLFESEEQISIQRSNKCSLYTVLNWKDYQSDERKVRNKRGTSEEQVRTTEEGKERKKKSVSFLTHPKDLPMENGITQYGDLFDTLWEVYPKHTNKKKSYAAFYRTCTNPEMAKIIYTAVQKHAADWKAKDVKVNFVPNLEKWLNGNSWEDELK